MIRALSILASGAALAVSAAPASASSEIAVESLTLGVTAAPVASAGTSKKPPPRGTNVGIKRGVRTQHRESSVQAVGEIPRPTQAGHQLQAPLAER